MRDGKPSALVVDDERLNLMILTEHLEDNGYSVICAENGLQAWEQLQETPDCFDVVLLDIMMPEMNGMELLSRIKAHPNLNTLPVIMQTAMARNEDILAGLKAGAYYYLTKPFNKEQLLTIVKAAIDDNQRYRALQEETQRTRRTLSFMNKGSFNIRTLKEGHDLVTLLANALPDASKVAMGLSELMINAVEHGNLGVTYDDKSKLKEQGIWEEEIERRQLLPENAGKTVTLEFERTAGEVSFLIQDQGDGFDWQRYLEIAPERAFDNHGRGIAMANMLSFDRLEYRGNGNQVIATITVNAV